MKLNWEKYWVQENIRLVFIVSHSVLALVLYSFFHFLEYNELRRGFVFNDPILEFFTPVDVSALTFFITYSSCIAGLVIALRSPEQFLKLIQAYAVLTLLRMLCLYFVPLEPPVKMIPLNDVFLNSTFYGGRQNLKDLFFSGHTATIFLFALLFTNKKVKIIFTIAASVVGLLVIIQHVHYSIDVIAATLFSYIAYRIQKIIPQKFGINEKEKNEFQQRFIEK